MTSDEDLMDEMRRGSRTAFETLFGLMTLFAGIALMLRRRVFKRGDAH